MADLEVTWRGITLGGDALPDVDVEQISGWDDLPDLQDMSQPRTRGHGDHPGDLFSQARVVTVTGTIASRRARDTLARVLMAGSPVSSPVEPLTIETFGRSLTAGARLVRRSLPVGENYAAGNVPFVLQWRCPDPLRYGPEQSLSTGLPTSAGGLVFPLFGSGALNWGPPDASGQLTLVNPGTADAGIDLAVTGGLQAGFEVSAAGERITYPTAVPAGQTVDIDTAAGTVLVEGTADRRGELLRADWFLVPAAAPDGTPGSLTLQFTSLGGPYDPAARLTARWKETTW